MRPEREAEIRALLDLFEDARARVEERGEFGAAGFAIAEDIRLGLRDLLAETVRLRAEDPIRLLLDGLEVGTIAELRTLVRLGRRV